MAASLAPALMGQLAAVKEFFDRSTRVLDEGDSSFAPQPGMMTVAQQVAHVAQTVDWFLEGMSRPEGFDLNFPEHMKLVTRITSLQEAREWHRRASDAMIAHVSKMSDEDLYAPLPAGPVMGGAPRLAVVGGIDDHTAHHRGALTVYSRLLGKVPPLPYMDT